jgi:chromosome partitioning protein
VLCKQCSQQIDVMILASMYDIRTKMAREILGEVRKHFAGKMFKTIVNFNTKLKEAASLGQPIGEYEPASKGHRDFQNLAEELIGTDTHMHRAELVSSLQAKLDAISASAEELLSTVKIPTVVTTEIRKETGGHKIVDLPAATPSRTETSTPEPAAVAVMAPAATATAVATRPAVKDIDAKLAEFYGVRQIEDLVIINTLYPRADSVFVAGDFNNWQGDKTPLQKLGDNGMWQIKMPLASGRYRYRLVVDGQWQQDPYNEKTELNPFGELNSVLEIH